MGRSWDQRGWVEDEYTPLYIYVMYSTKVTLWLRREHGCLSTQASTDRKAGRFLLPFYSIKFFGINSLQITSQTFFPSLIIETNIVVVGIKCIVKTSLFIHRIGSTGVGHP